MRFILFQPDIPQNTGAILRLAAAFGAPVDIIGPLGYVLDDKKLRRAGMDYVNLANWQLLSSWDAFRAQNQSRLILLSTKASIPYYDHSFDENDGLILGRESSGVPDFVHDAAAIRVRIPIKPPARSLNVAQAGAIVMAEAMRQLGRLADSDRS